MSVYPLLTNIKATQPAPSPTSPPVLVVSPPPPTAGSGSPTTNAGWQVVVAAPGGIQVGAEVNIVASNDGQNWATITTITCASATSPVTSLQNLVVPYASYGAYCKTLTGSGATLNCTMSA